MRCSKATNPQTKIAYTIIATTVDGSNTAVVSIPGATPLLKIPSNGKMNIADSLYTKFTNPLAKLAPVSLSTNRNANKTSNAPKI